MKLQELRDMQPKALADRVEDLKKDLFFLRMKATMGQLGNTREINKVKKEVARALTVLSERQTAKSEGKA